MNITCFSMGLGHWNASTRTWRGVFHTRKALESCFPINLHLRGGGSEAGWLDDPWWTGCASEEHTQVVLSHWNSQTVCRAELSFSRLTFPGRERSTGWMAHKGNADHIRDSACSSPGPSPRAHGPNGNLCFGSGRVSGDLREGMCETCTKDGIQDQCVVDLIWLWVSKIIFPNAMLYPGFDLGMKKEKLVDTLERSKCQPVLQFSTHV